MKVQTRDGELRGARASRVLAMASRHRGLFPADVTRKSSITPSEHNAGSSSRRDAATGTRDACAPRRQTTPRHSIR